MASGFWKFFKGIRLNPETSSSASLKGEMEVDNTTGKLKYHNGTTLSPAVTEAHAATLTNKTLDDTTTVIADSTDGTKQIKLDAAGTTGTSTTILSSQTTNKVLTLPDATDTLVGKATTDTLTNKTLTAPVISTISNTGTLTLPTSSDTLVGRATTDTLTNKTISGASNTLSNIPNGATTATNANTPSAIVARDGSGNFSAGTISAALIGNVTGNVSGTASNVTGTISIGNGGTGQATKAAAFDALSPNTTKGDITVYGSSTNTRVPIGSDGQVPVADSTQTTGLAWKTLQQGAKNYIVYNSFENNATTGWGLLTTTLTGGIPTGTITASAASVTTFATTSTNPLAGTYSLQTASSGVWSAGQGFISQAYNLDREDYKFGRVMAFSARYEIVSGQANLDLSGTTTNTFAVYIYDVTNSAWIQPAGVYSIMGDGLVKGTVQLPTTCTSFRLAIVAVNASLGAATINWDDFSFGPQSISYGAPITDMTPYSATVAGVTPTASFFGYSRVGDRLRVKGWFNTFGGVAAVNAKISLPAGLSIDTSKYPSTLGNKTTKVGYWNTLVSGAAQAWYLPSGVLILDSSDLTNVYLSNESTSGAFVEHQASFYWGTTERVDFDFEVPILGWSSSLQLSQDTDTRVCAAMLVSSVNQSVSNATDTLLNLDTANIDTHGGFNASTHKYTVQVPGVYSLRGTIQWPVNGSGIRVARIYKNGVIITDSPWPTSSVNSVTAFTSTTLKLVVGDVIEFHGYQDTGGALNAVGTTAGLDYTRLEIIRLSGPSQIAASEKVTASYYMSVAKTGSTSAPYDFDTKIFDSHGMVTTGASWKATAPISGIYRISVLVNPGANPSNYLDIYKNGSMYSFLGYTGGGVWQGSRLVKLLAGEYIDIRPEASVTTTSDSRANYIDIERVG